jgi:hypothetical protein
MNVPDYNFQQSEPDQSLALNEFYFAINDSGNFIKTKNREEFLEISSWESVIFAGKIKSHQFLHFKIAGSWKKVLFSRLPTSQPIGTGVFDLHILQSELSSHLSEIKFGGRDEPENFETL